MLLEQKRWSEAEPALRRALAAGNERLRGHLVRGLMDAGRLDEAHE